MAAPNLKSWTRAEYDRLANSGAIGPDDRLELVDGQIFEKMTHNTPHAVAVTLILEWLGQIQLAGLHVRAQLPIALSNRSAPEPDIAVVRGRARDFLPEHPSPMDIALLIEVSHSSVDRDRRIKLPLYAAAGIQEVWLPNIDAGTLEVHRDPQASRYASLAIVKETASPLFDPSASVQVSNLLPS